MQPARCANMDQSIESCCAAVLAESNQNLQKKRKRGRPRGKTKKNLCRTIPAPLAVGRRTRMSLKVAECLQKCVENVDVLRHKKAELARQITECDDEIEANHKRAAHAATAISLHMVDSFTTRTSQNARHERAKAHPRKVRKRRKTRVRYTRTHLRNALESLVVGHKTEHSTAAEKRAATSVRRAALIHMDGKHVTLGRILKKHNVIEKIKTLSLYVETFLPLAPLIHLQIDYECVLHSSNFLHMCVCVFHAERMH